jgi:16S rRNA (adenine1518-N6/adenine1519-N6)-dimethyltransferase
LESEIPPQEMILMVQKEVAERIVASPGKMSILALSVQYFATAQILFPVPSMAFFPVPKVESAIIRIAPNSTTILPLKRGGIKGGVERKKFFRIVRAGFSAKRKTLANNLANSFHLDKKAVENKLNKLGLAPLTRAQELSLEDWKKLAKIV